SNTCTIKHCHKDARFPYANTKQQTATTPKPRKLRDSSVVLCAEASQTTRTRLTASPAGPFPQDPTVCPEPRNPYSVVPTPPEGGGTSRAAITLNRITSAPLVSCHPTTRTVMKDESAP